MQHDQFDDRWAVRKKVARIKRRRDGLWVAKDASLPPDRGLLNWKAQVAERADAIAEFSSHFSALQFCWEHGWGVLSTPKLECSPAADRCCTHIPWAYSPCCWW